jgi:hypothetical protein
MHSFFADILALKKLQRQTATRDNVCKTLSYEKGPVNTDIIDTCYQGSNQVSNKEDALANCLKFEVAITNHRPAFNGSVLTTNEEICNFVKF